MWAFVTAPPRRLHYWAFLIPCLIFLVHSLLFAHWIVDDAGISFVYSRSLAQGYGLVAQPGAAHIEGYSNFLWVLLMAPFFAINAFDPTITPKVVGTALVIASFFLVGRTFNVKGRSSWEAVIALSLLSLNTSFVVWAISGLENPLYLFLLCCLMALLAETPTTKSAVLSGLLVAACAMTRPDGVMFGIVPALFFILHLLRGHVQNGLKLLAVYIGAFAGVFGSFLLFRLYYFGDVVPNTYRMKGGPKISDVVSIFTLQPEMRIKLVDVLDSVVAGGGIWLVAALLAGLFYLRRLQVLDRLTVVCGSLFCVGLMCYMLLPMDWMDEYRFATPLVTFAYLSMVLVAASCLKQLNPYKSRMLVVCLMTIGVVNGLFTVMVRSQKFANEPTVPFDVVAQEFGSRFNRYTSILALRGGSIALPDVGGTLYYSKLRVVDTGGLVDREVALTMSKKQRQFYDYIFDQQKPTFIHTHEPWCYLSNFDGDSRFRRDYVALSETTSAKNVIAGDYIRRDIASKNPHYQELLKNFVQ